MSFIHAKLQGELLTFPQVSNDGLEGRHYLLIRAKKDERPPEWIFKNRNFEWKEGRGYNSPKMTASMKDEIGNYCVYTDQPVVALGDCKPGDVVEVDVIIYPVSVARQKRDNDRNPTGDIHLSAIPTMYFCVEGNLRKASAVAAKGK